LSPDLKIKKFAASFKSMNKWIIGICVSVFTTFFSVQGLTSASYDGISRKAAKYAIGNGIPIVGGFLSGGFDLAVAGSILIKNSLGILGIFMMASVVAKPLLLLVCTNVFLRFTAAVCEPIGDQRISDFLGETADHINYFTAGLLLVAFLYLVTIVLLVCSAEVVF
jgi:stage III sporulation protein AE